MSDHQHRSKLIDFTFEDTGISVKIRKLSPMIATDVANAFPEPVPPSQEVDYGPPKGKVIESNLLDPDYLQAKADRQQRMLLALQRVMILRSVIVEGDDWRSEVKEYRRFILETTGAAVEEAEDLVVYVLRLCVGSEEDLTDLLSVITKRSQPTPEAIQAAKASFRS